MKRSKISAGSARLNRSGKRIMPFLTVAGMISLLFSGCMTMEKKALIYVEEVKAAQPAAGSDIPGPGTIITRKDISSLPEPVQKYFLYSQVLGKPRISSYSVILQGRIRNSAVSDWMPLIMRQYNRVDVPSRVVYIESPGKPMAGIDSFMNNSGRMHIKVLNFITVADSKGPEMTQSALVTFMNDLVLCPVAYFSLPVQWKGLDDRRAELALTAGNLTARAVLTFDPQGRLVNWESAERYADVKGRSLKDQWSTPFSGYGEISGLQIPVKGAGIHNYDGKPYVYIELESINSLIIDAPGLPPRP